MKQSHLTILKHAAADLQHWLNADRPVFDYGGQCHWEHAREGLVKCDPARWVEGWEGHPYQRMRFVRVLDGMQRAGLIVRVGYEGGSLTHLRLTDEGRAALAATEGNTDA